MDYLQKKNLIKDNLLDGKGYVKVVDIFPRIVDDGRTPEYIIAKSARVSYGEDNKTPNQDKALIQFLIKNQHTSPLEMCNITFCIKAPLAICTQILRHRTFKFNQFSQRYSEVSEEMGRMEMHKNEKFLRKQSKINHQASEIGLDDTQIVLKKLQEAEELQNKIKEKYKELLELGFCKELARMYLPQATYSTLYLQADLNNLMKFLKLRCAPDAQVEIQEIANSMYQLAKQFFPISFEVMDNYLDSTYLGKLEKKMIKEKKIPQEITSKSERKKFEDLARELGITLE